VEVTTEAKVAPVLPATVAEQVNSSATGVATEDRPVVWEAIAPQRYAAPGVFEVSGTIEGVSEKAKATVTVVSSTASSATLTGAARVQPGQQFEVVYGLKNVNQKVYAQDFTIVYDADKLELVGSPATINDKLFNVVGTNAKAGSIRVLGVHHSDSVDQPNQNLVKLVFRAKNVAGVTDIKVTELLVSDADGPDTALGGDTHFVEIRTPSVPGDFNNDDKVTVGDLALVAKAYGKTSASDDWDQVKAYDINKDGVIDIEDLVAMARLVLGN
jgi:hypothetical protein